MCKIPKANDSLENHEFNGIEDPLSWKPDTSCMKWNFKNRYRVLQQRLLYPALRYLDPLQSVTIDLFQIESNRVNSYNNVRCPSPSGKSLCVCQRQLAQGSLNVYTSEVSWSSRLWRSCQRPCKITASLKLSKSVRFSGQLWNAHFFLLLRFHITNLWVIGYLL